MNKLPLLSQAVPIAIVASLMTFGAVSVTADESLLNRGESAHKGQHCMSGSQGYHKMHGGMGNPDFMLKKMTRFLDLTDEQIAEIEGLMASKEDHQAHRQEMFEFREQLHEAAENGASESQLLELATQMAQLKAQHIVDRVQKMQQVKAVLTDEQREKLEEKMQKMKERHQQKWQS